MSKTDAKPSVYLHQALLPLGIKSFCAVCSVPFDNELRRGRPKYFCSDKCRQLQLKRQKKNWAVAQKSGAG
jgi:predicted nucleic acid-binding Zn ribbon protein